MIRTATLYHRGLDGKAMATLPEAEFFISNPEDIPEGACCGAFEYEPADQFCTYIPDNQLQRQRPGIFDGDKI